MGVLRKIALTPVVIVVAIAVLGYTPLPDGMDSHLYAQAIPAKFLQRVMKFGEFLGFGHSMSHILTLQETLQTGEPASASYEGVNSTREVMSGVSVIVYRPVKAQPNAPSFIFIHGGGFTLLSADFFDNTVYQYMLRTQAVVFSIDYRRSPQHKFPTSVNDCLTATKHILRHGGKYGADVNKMGIMGDSAGGNLAASVALNLTREKPRDLPSLKFVVMHYPMLQAFDFHTPSYLEFGDLGIFAGREEIIAGYSYYLGAEVADIEHYLRALTENRHLPPALRRSAKYTAYMDRSKLPEEFRKRTAHLKPPAASEPYNETIAARISSSVTDPMFSPLLADDLSGFPPTLVYVSEFDVLRDEGLLFHRRLVDAGVEARLMVNRGGHHGDVLLYPPAFLNSAVSEKRADNSAEFVLEMYKKMK